MTEWISLYYNNKLLWSNKPVLRTWFRILSGIDFDIKRKEHALTLLLKGTRSLLINRIEIETVEHKKKSSATSSFRPVLLWPGCELEIREEEVK